MRKKKKRRINIRKIVFIFVFISLITLFVLWYINRRVTNIYVIGNDLLHEQEIIEKANIEDYPKVVSISKKEIIENLLKEDFIKDASVSISLFGKVTISVVENTILYREHDSYMLSSGKFISLDNKNVSVPILINEVEKSIVNNFVDKMSLIDRNILIRISEIEYKPSELDNERFLFYMTDGNYVYITLSKINSINSYDSIYPTLEGKKGILYLDSGNHFEIKKAS